MREVFLAGWHHDADRPGMQRLSVNPETDGISLQTIGLHPGATLFALDDDDIWALALPRMIAMVAADHASIVAVLPNDDPDDVIELEAEEAAAMAGPWRRWIDYLYVNEPLAALAAPWTVEGWREGAPQPERSRLKTAPLGGVRTFQSGDTATAAIRSLFRSVDPWGVRWADPFRDTGDGSFRAWAEEREANGLPRWARAVYWSRPDLRESFVMTTPTPDLESWLRDNGLGPAPTPSRRRSPLQRLLPKRSLADTRPAPSHAEGVNVAGYLSAQSGLGQAARHTLEALDGLEVSTVDMSHRIHSPRRIGAPSTGMPHDVSIFHLNPPELVGYANDSLAMRLAASWSIGFFFWEAAQLPADWLDGLGAVDEIWTASEFTRTALMAATDRPIEVMGLAVDAPAVEPMPADLGLSQDTFICTYITDALSGRYRKNPLAAMDAFEIAFGGSDDAVLLLKVANLDKDPELAAELTRRSTASGTVRLLTRDLAREDLWALLAATDVYLSLHSSESLGLTILEAMSLGVPAVATGFGGNIEYLDDGNGVLVPFRLVPARGGIYEGLGDWAEPDIEAAAASLVGLRNDPGHRRRLGRAARETVHRHYTPQAYRDRVRGRLRLLGIP